MSVEVGHVVEGALALLARVLLHALVDAHVLDLGSI
jgi:hypothetical protein